MSRLSVARLAILVTVALLLTLTFGTVAMAQEAAQPAAAATNVAAPGGTEGESSQEASGEAAGAEAEKEIPHTVGNLTPAQRKDLDNAFLGMDGYSILIVSVLGLLVAVGIIGFGVVKQTRV